MKTAEVLHAWSSILAGRAPSLSIEITKECPLRCPGCYAYDAAHLGSDVLLRQLSDFKGDELVRARSRPCRPAPSAPCFAGRRRPPGSLPRA